MNYEKKIQGQINTKQIWSMFSQSQRSWNLGYKVFLKASSLKSSKKLTLSPFRST